jgi:hypothetical protein
MAAASALVLAAAAPASAARKSGARLRTWYVSALSPAPGAGTRGQPFASLAAVERVSRPGDTIVILPASRPLTGGIALKPRQKLIGAGPPMVATRLAATPRIDNTDPASHSGDAVELADGATVSNLAIGPSYRGAIYGSDVTGARVIGNDISDQNTSCTTGFLVLPFVLPTTVPGVGLPLSGLPNGWAGIMIDARSAAGTVAIRNNYVHDAACGDGIDIRLSGTARIRASIAGNFVTRLRQGQQFLSLLAIGMQTRDAAQLTAGLSGNTETDVGSILGVETNAGAGLPGAGADSEGVFANLAGHSILNASVEHNTWRHGIGGFSVNGMEMVITSGSPTAAMRISNSSFSDGPGDLLEEINFGTRATMSLDLEHVTATHSTGLGNTYVLPGNNGDCLVMGHTGAGDSTALRMRYSELSGCANNGLTVASGVDNGSHGAAGSLSFDIDHSRITGNHGDNLRIATENALTALTGKVQYTDLSGARLTDLALEQLAGTAAHTTLDFGSGQLGSAGHNCISGGGLLDAETIGYRAAARNDWWGTPLVPVVAVGGSIDARAALARPPTGVC